MSKLPAPIHSALADRFGILDSQIAALSKERAALREEFIRQSASAVTTAFEGELFRVVTSFAERTTTDWRTIAEAFAAQHPVKFRNLLREHTQPPQVVPGVRVFSRKVPS